MKYSHTLKGLVFLIIGMVFIISFASATLESFGIFKQDSNVRITQTCSDATYVTISSVMYPNSSVAISNKNMSYAGGGEFYYNFSYTNPLGRYDVRGISDGCDKTFSFYFDITESGDAFNLPQALILLGQFGLIALFFGIGLTFKQEKWKLKTFFFICALFMGIIFLNSIRIIIGTSSNLAKMGLVGLILGIIILSFMFLYVLINYTIEVFHYFKDKGRMKWEISGQ